MTGATQDSSPWENPNQTHQLTADELSHIRHLLREDDRASWLRKKVKVFTPWFIAVVGAMWAVGDWVYKHFKWSQ